MLDKPDIEDRRVAQELADSREEAPRAVGELMLSRGDQARPYLEKMIDSPSAVSQAWAVYGILALEGLDATAPSKRLSKLAGRGHAKAGRWSAIVFGALAAVASFSLALYIALTAAVDRDLFFAIVLGSAAVTVLLVLVAAALNLIQRAVAVRREERQKTDLEQIDIALDRIGSPENNAPRSPERRITELDPRIRTTLSSYADRPELIELALHSYSKSEDRIVAGFLAASGVRQDIQNSLISARSKSRRVRDIHLLGWFAGKESLPLLVQLTGASDLGIVLSATSALSKYNSPLAFKVLLQMLRDERLPRSRVADFLTFSPYRDKTPLIAADIQNSYPKIRRWTAYLLGRTSDSRALPPLYRLCEDRSDEVAAEAVESLGELPDGSSVMVIEKLLGHPSWLVRAHAVKAAKKLQAAELIPGIASLLRDDEWWVRQNAALALASMGEAAVPQLIMGLSDQDRFVRNKSAEILERIGVVGQYIQDLKTDGTKRARAHKLLVAVGKAEAEGVLEDRLLRADPALQCRLIEVLSDVGRPDTVPTLEQARNTTVSTQVRKVANNAIAKIREAA